MATLQKFKSIQDDQTKQRNYLMTLPRLGIAMIIDKMSIPQSKADVGRLKDAYETPGFDVYTYNDGDSAKYETIKTWMCAKETHQFCNAFSLVMMCQEGDDGTLLDINGEKLTSVDDLVKEVTEIPTLKDKPKLITIQAYPERKPDGTRSELPRLPPVDDVLISYNQIADYKLPQEGENADDVDEKECGSENLIYFSTLLKNEYKEKSVQEIFNKVDTDTKEKARLTESLLMQLARWVPATAMESIAIEHLGINSAVIKNLKQSTDIVGEKLSFELLRKWKNKGNETTKEKLAEYLKKSDEVDSYEVEKVLSTSSEGPQLSSDVKYGLTCNLDLSDFHATGAKKIKQLEARIDFLNRTIDEQQSSSDNKIKELENDKVLLKALKDEKQVELKKAIEEHVKIKNGLSDEITKLKRKDEENMKLLQKYQQEIDILNKDLEENQKKIEIIKAEKEVESKKLKEVTDLLEDEKKKYEKKITKMKEEWERDENKRWEAEWKTQKNLTEAAELSAERLKSLGKDKDNVEGEALVDKFKAMKDEKQIVVNENKVIEYEKEVSSLKQQLRDAAESERKIIEQQEKMKTSHEQEKSRLQEEMKTSYDEQIIKLQEENRKLRGGGVAGASHFFHEETTSEPMGASAKKIMIKRFSTGELPVGFDMQKSIDEFIEKHTSMKTEKEPK